MADVDRKYIKGAIDNLVETVGIKKDVTYGSLVKLFNANKVKECIKAIANYLGLPIDINLSYVSSTYQASSNGSQQNRFESQKLVKTDKHGRGVEGITAQVSIPAYLPLYGTSALINFPIDVKISENVKEYPGVFIGIMAHELSHILLHSLRHPQKDNEFYTDLTAMLLGFNNVMEFSRRTEKTETKGNIITTHTTTYGYLDSDNFYFAFSEIQSLYSHLRKEKAGLLIKIDKNKKLIKNTVKLYKVLKENFSWISSNLNTIKIKGKSSDVFVQMQNFIYQNPDFENELLPKEKNLSNIYNAVINKKTYCPNKDKEFENWGKELSKKSNDIKEQYSFFRKSISIQIKYVKPVKKISSLLTLVGTI